MIRPDLAHAIAPLDMRIVRARQPVTVTVNQPIAGGTYPGTGRLVGEVWARSELHHYRVSLGSTMLITPPSWLASDSYMAALKAGLSLPDRATVPHAAKAETMG